MIPLSCGYAAFNVSRFGGKPQRHDKATTLCWGSLRANAGRHDARFLEGWPTSITRQAAGRSAERLVPRSGACVRGCEKRVDYPLGVVVWWAIWYRHGLCPRSRRSPTPSRYSCPLYGQRPIVMPRSHPIAPRRMASVTLRHTDKHGPPALVPIRSTIPFLHSPPAMYIVCTM